MPSAKLKIALATAKFLRPSDIRILGEAIEGAAEWRGNTHPDDWEEFDKRIKKMEEALERARTVRAALKYWETYGSLK